MKPVLVINFTEVCVTVFLKLCQELLQRTQCPGNDAGRGQQWDWSFAGSIDQLYNVIDADCRFAVRNIHPTTCDRGIQRYIQVDGLANGTNESQADFDCCELKNRQTRSEVHNFLSALQTMERLLQWRIQGTKLTTWIFSNIWAYGYFKLLLRQMVYDMLKKKISIEISIFNLYAYTLKKNQLSFPSL